MPNASFPGGFPWGILSYYAKPLVLRGNRRSVAECSATPVFATGDRHVSEKAKNNPNSTQKVSDSHVRLGPDRTLRCATRCERLFRRHAPFGRDPNWTCPPKAMQKRRLGAADRAPKLWGSASIGLLYQDGLHLGYLRKRPMGQPRSPILRMTGGGFRFAVLAAVAKTTGGGPT